ncbi:TIGR04283 family arsenosugar biosynthesis glycosyltransferase [bacterium]|nr:TIGR04283 family arsenosugar biosynthesis glycosyltransferase [bacterium]
MKLTAIVPMLNEERAIEATLEALRRGAPDAEIIVVDGGSSDRSVALARARCDRVIVSARGRARQMNAGAAAAAGDALVFVHADTLVGDGFGREIAAALTNPAVIGGRFDVAFDEYGGGLRMVAAMINLRSRMMRSATGDQAIFVRRDAFFQLGGFAEIELCEDVDFVRRMKRLGRLACLRATVQTSSRRWRSDGVGRTIFRMWLIKTLYFAGASPAWLKRHYADAR